MDDQSQSYTDCIQHAHSMSQLLKIYLNDIVLIKPSIKKAKNARDQHSVMN